MKLLRAVLAISFLASISIQYGYSEDCFSTGANSAGNYEFRMIKDEGMKIGDGTPTTTMNGEDLYVEGTFEVDGASRFDGAMTLGSTVALNGAVTVNSTFVLPTIDVAVTTPTVAGQMCKTSTYLLYIATATTGVAAWSKVGAQ